MHPTFTPNPRALVETLSTSMSELDARSARRHHEFHSGRINNPISSYMKRISTTSFHVSCTALNLTFFESTGRSNPPETPATWKVDVMD